jgi:hypothetical protein
MTEPNAPDGVDTAPVTDDPSEDSLPEFRDTGDKNARPYDDEEVMPHD